MLKLTTTNKEGIMEDRTFVTNEARLSYCTLCKPAARNAGEVEKYSVTVLVPKTDTATMSRIRAAVDAAKKRGADTCWNGQIPPVCPDPVHDGDGQRPSDGMPYGDECKGHWVFTSSCDASHKPEIVDANRNPIIDQSEIYSGMYGRVCVTAFPYNNNGRKGVGFSLGPVQKTRDGESLGGTTISAEAAFGAADGAGLL